MKRINLIQWLDRNTHFGKFPPFGLRIKGLSHILYEGLRSSKEAKLYLYALANSGTVRGLRTPCAQSLFSEACRRWTMGPRYSDYKRRTEAHFRLHHYHCNEDGGKQVSISENVHSEQDIYTEVTTKTTTGYSNT